MGQLSLGEFLGAFLMKPPIIINESKYAEIAGDLSVYCSIELTERAHEYDSAFDDHQHAYDSEGLLLKIVPNEDRRAAHLEPAEATPSQRDLLIAILRDYLAGFGAPKAAVEAMDLDGLIAAAYQRAPNLYAGLKGPPPALKFAKP
jgi:hypothetical protein